MWMNNELKHVSPIFKTQTQEDLGFEHKMYELDTEELKLSIADYALTFGITQDINTDHC